ncbi:type I-E CRISPR-associated protein Cse1/CasA [Propioniciclava sinopodophylli]|uniref:type I-E CRISPR-associated protein Cse1/CasA n=1 Tax=Propioniciclava sinopodophylli TaxID=1837344 RepID=UPI00249079A7|nr:type I-E CRISPR-associated protein Cse1/CasA [Propioniciclava sinopodophylli]
MSFNLVTEPWIPVVYQDGSTADVSMSECFADASTITRIGGDLPTQSFALLRLLLAICHDAIGFHSQRAVRRVISQGLDTASIVSYLNDSCDRFDLFHSTRPFMQVATLHTAKNEAAGLEKLISDVPNGAPFLTTRGGRSLQRISPAEAARWLIHAHAFDPSGIRSAAVGDPNTKGGKGYPIGPGWAGQIGGVVLHGRNLAETLGYNLIATPDNPADRPVWALTAPHTEQRQIEPEVAGPVQLLVWQSRRIRLVGDHTGVTGVVLCQGDRMTPQNRHDIEAMTAWRYSKPQSKKFGIPVYMPLKHDPAKDGWRGFPSMVSTQPTQEDGQDGTRRPATVMTLAEVSLDLDLDLDAVVGLEMVGIDYGAQEATVAELYHDRLDFRIGVLGEQAVELRTLIQDATRLADDCVWEVGRMAAHVARAAGDFDGVEGTQERVRTEAWAALDHDARTWLADLRVDSDATAAKRAWHRIIRRVIESEADRVASAASPAADRGRVTKYGFMTTAKAEVFLRRALRDKLPLAYPPPNTKKESLDE